MKSISFIFYFFICYQISVAQCITNAGPDLHKCPSDSLPQLGGNPSGSGGVSPYVYEWRITPFATSISSLPFIYASHFLDDTALANPTMINDGSFIGDSVIFFLKVTDANNCQNLDTVIYTNSSFGMHLGIFQYSITQGDSVFLNQGPNIFGGFGNSTYLWSPSDGLSDTTLVSGFWAKPDTNIAYTATVTDSKGCQETAGGPTYFINVTPVGLNDLIRENNFIALYPIPTSGRISIENTSFNRIMEVRVYSLTGQLLSVQNNSSVIDLETFDLGVYIVELYTQDGNVLTQKIIKE